MSRPSANCLNPCSEVPMSTEHESDVDTAAECHASPEDAVASSFNGKVTPGLPGCSPSPIFPARGDIRASLESSKHGVVVRRGVRDRLQHVPVLNDLALVVEAEDVDGRMFPARPVWVAYVDES